MAKSAKKKRDPGGGEQAELNPFEPVRRSCVRMVDVLALARPDGKPLLSEFLKRTLGFASATSEHFAEGGITVVDPLAYLIAIVADTRSIIGDGGETLNLEDNVALAHIFFEERNAGDLARRVNVRDVSEDDRDKAVLHPDMVDVLDEAWRISRKESSPERINTRHVFAALIFSPAGRTAFGELGLARKDNSKYFVDLLRDFSAWMSERLPDTALPIMQYPMPEDLTLPLSFRPPPIILESPTYLSDTTAGEDALDIDRDVKAFAELICLKDMTPPLSIGLFGDWGSGKTFFMEQLANVIEATASREAEEKTRTGVFVERVVQIRFNAWNYADANLWASLTAEFFDQLRTGGYRSSGHQLTGATTEPGERTPHRRGYADLVKEVASTVRSAEETAEKLGGEVKDLDKDLVNLERSHSELKEQRDQVAMNVLEDSAAGLVKEFLAQNGPKVASAAKALDLGSASLDDETFRAHLKEIQDLTGKLDLIRRLVTKALLGRDRVLLIAVAATILLAVVATALPTVLPEVPWAQIGSRLAWLAGPVAAIGGLWRGLRIVSPILTAAARFAKDEENQRRSLDADIVEIESQIKRKKQEKVSLRAQHQAEEDVLSRYAPALEGKSPGALLRFFLERSAEVQQYEELLGLVSRVRRTFETLDTLIKRQKAAEAPETIDRIVLYIDDLDRCKEETVVKVLEAVHLLLAFDLFVVVVAVDARWLEQSLKEIYGQQLAAADQGNSAKAGVHDYLEKIFQIALWLRPLETGADGTYQRLVETLIGPDVMTSEGGKKDDSDSQQGDVGGGDLDQGDPQFGDGDQNGKMQRLTLERARVTLTPEPEERPEETRQRVMLAQKEVDLIKALGPVAGKSPRAVKRLLNLYRLIRSQHHDGAGGSLAFSHDRVPPHYPAVLFVLAMEVGLGGEAHRRLTEALHQLPPEQPLESLHAAFDLSKLDAPLVQGTPYQDTQGGDLQAFWKALPVNQRTKVKDAIDGVGQALGPEASLADLRDQLIEIGRYTFRRPGHMSS